MPNWGIWIGLVLPALIVGGYWLAAALCKTSKSEE